VELIDTRAKVFRIDVLAETIAALRRSVDTNRKAYPARLQGVIGQAPVTANAALQADRLAEALAAVEVASDAAKAVVLAAKSRTKPIKDPRLVEQAGEVSKQMDEMTKQVRRRLRARDDMKAAAETLEKSPDDPAANGVVGGYECFVLGDWNRGLAKLAKAAPGKVRDAAAEELRLREAPQPDVKDRFSLAGRWWDLAEKEELEATAAAAIRGHSAALYAVCLEGLTDPLDLAIARKRAGDAKPTGKPKAGGEVGGGRGKNAYPERGDPARRAELLEAGGGNDQSEAAVDAALKWIIAHQLPDGGWSFNNRACPDCQGQCGDSGNSDNDRCAATAMGLLPLLGRGYTHKEGPYAKEVERGLGFLSTLVLQGDGKAYGREGSLYSQGVAGMALAEAYAMTRDPRLKPPAQLALNFIMTAQDPNGGGWRYMPKQPGDTSASGWNLVALRIGADGGLQVNPAVVANMGRFLDSVQENGGAAYGYTSPGDGLGTTAVGLLCRLHLGWKPDNPAIVQGAADLASRTSVRDIYHVFYANQVLYRVGGEGWKTWNRTIRDTLVQGQDKVGHQSGSWYDAISAGHGPFAGGRLYCTSLAALVLENYYRNPPAK
jgi:hypothetical protein